MKGLVLCEQLIGMSRSDPSLVSQWCNGIIYNTKRIPYMFFQHYINHTPYMVRIDHCASIQVCVMVHVMDNLKA